MIITIKFSLLFDIRLHCADITIVTLLLPD
nr:MAG TPA: hypothetical protein [Bacteriophage sp.]